MDSPPKEGLAIPEHLTVCQALCEVFPGTIPPTISANPEGNRGHAQLTDGQTKAQERPRAARRPWQQEAALGLKPLGLWLEVCLLLSTMLCALR